MKKLPGGITFEISPFPDLAIKYYSQVSHRFGAEIAESLYRQRRATLKALEDCTSGTAAWNTDFDSAKITPRLLEIISRSRFVFASFGHTTKNIIQKMDKRIKNNIRDIFITQSMISTVMPGNLHKWTFPFSENSTLLSSNFPNLEKVAVEVKQWLRDTYCLSEMVRWYDEGIIKQLEIVYAKKKRDAGGEEWGWQCNNYQFKEDPTVEDCYQLLWEYTFGEDRDPAKRWKVIRVDEDEVNERGRFFINHEYPYVGTEMTMVEGSVFRMIREPIETFKGASEEENLKFIKACGRQGQLVRRFFG
ncbi:hypothetical protein TWF481_009022 [Arthrobotrys musiformis]